jgi:hypothetical protein
MNRMYWWLINLLSRTLEPDERVAVQGDLAEGGDSAPQALRHVAGLVLRRQLALWKHWQPWLALLGFTIITGPVLSRLIVDFDGTLYRKLYWLGTGAEFYNFRTDTEENIYLVCLVLALFLWSWISGFVLKSLSYRATWLTSALFYLATVNTYLMQQYAHGSLWVHREPATSKDIVLVMALKSILPLDIGTVFLFMLPAFLGGRYALRQHILAVHQAVWLAFTAAGATGLVAWSSGFYGSNRAAMSHGMYIATPWEMRLWPLALLSWPLVYIGLTALKQVGAETKMANTGVHFTGNGGGE